MHPYADILQTCMAALGRSDYAMVKSLFAPTGRVLSPFLGEMPASPSFDRLAGASSSNGITNLDLIYDTHLIRASAGNKYAL